MKISEISVRNFRCLRDIRLPLGDMTVIIGENNAGKTALLDAIKIVLGRRSGLRGTGFSEYDLVINSEGSAPQERPPITIELVFEESRPGEWPPALNEELFEIVITNPTTNVNSITLRAECGYSDIADGMETVWHFVARDGKAFAGGGRSATSTHPFFLYVPVFSLLALRDASQEFSSRSQFWSQLLKRIRVSDEKWGEIREALSTLNENIITADTKLSAIRDKIQQLNTVVSPNVAGSVEVRALPPNVSDVLSRSEIFLRGRSGAPSLPLNRHGQGVQSLAVIYLFQAFVEHLLEDTYHKLAEPVLLLEEPEAHLHPQAARALGPEIKRLSGQKIVTTHSPFFLERIAFRDIRILRNFDNGAKVFTLRSQFKAQLPHNRALGDIVAQYGTTFRYDNVTEILTVTGSLSIDQYRRLLACYSDQADRDLCHQIIKKLYGESHAFISDEELRNLETWARRIRGEIFFARAWILCEGQSDFILLHLMNELLGYPLDINGIAVIDFQNNGSAGVFAALARALGYPWVLTCDGDSAGDRYVQAVRDRGFSSEEVQRRVAQLEVPDIEAYLAESPLRETIVTVLRGMGITLSDNPGAPALALAMRREKMAYAAALADRLRQDTHGTTNIPEFFRTLNVKIKEIADEQ